jgi:alkylation response protein AidB-like acyl-CoA dehydrogenase
MLLELTEDQEFLRHTTATYLSDSVPLSELRALQSDPVGFTEPYWLQGAELGWTSLFVPPELGGGSVSGRPLVDATLLAHEFGRHAAPGPFVSSNLAAAALCGPSPMRQTPTIKGVLDGSVVVSWSFTEAQPGGHRPEGLTLRVTEDHDDVVVEGTKRPVEAASVADALLVTGRTGDGLTQVLVPTDTPGLTLQPMRSVDLTRKFWTARFDGVRLPADAVVGTVGGAGPHVDHQLSVGLVLLCAESVGAMQSAFEMTVEWAFDRYSFGRPLASYQELKHRFADMKTWLEASHAVTDAAADAVEDDRPDAAELVSGAAAYVGEYGTELLQDCVQLHGGIGLTYEHDLHAFLRRVTLNRVLLGTPALHRRHLASLVIERDRA